jgi:hypothetical protein
MRTLSGRTYMSMALAKKLRKADKERTLDGALAQLAASQERLIIASYRLASRLAEAEARKRRAGR